AYLRRRYADVGRPPIVSATVQDAFPFSYGDWNGYLLAVRVQYHSGLPETDLLPVTFVPEDRLGGLLRPPPAWWLAPVQGKESGALIDALAAPAFCRSVLAAIVAGRSYAVGDGELTAVPFAGLADLLDRKPGDLPPRLYLGEQVNSSVIYDERLV